MLRVLLIALPVFLAGCGEAPESAAPAAPATKQALAGSPPPLASLHAQANELLPGGPAAFRERLAELKGFPVVVNKWASWCGPCREEFPHFQRQAVKRGKEVAFIGVNSMDNDGNAKAFLADYPVTYPSYKDGDGKTSKVFEGSYAFPTTAFYDKRGRLALVKPGGYKTEADLVKDIERYAR